MKGNMKQCSDTIPCQVLGCLPHNIKKLKHLCKYLANSPFLLGLVAGRFSQQAWGMFVGVGHVNLNIISTTMDGTTKKPYMISFELQNEKQSYQWV